MTPARDPDAVAWANAVQAAGGAVSGARLRLVSILIRDLKATGVWSALDRLWLFATENSTQARRDLVTRAVATPNNAPTFTVNRGYMGDGLSTYIDTGFNGSTAGGKYTQNGASFGVWVETAESDTSTNHPYIGNDETNFGYFQRTDSTTVGYAVNAGANGAFTFSTQTGLWMADRSASNLTTLYQNGASVATTGTGSVAIANLNFNVLAGNNGGSAYHPGSGRVAALVIGGSLGASKEAALSNRLRSYMTAVGVG